MSEPRQGAPQRAAPKALLRFNLYVLYCLYVGVPVLFAGAAVYAAAHHRWVSASVSAVLCAVEAVLGSKRLHGQWTWTGTGAVPELRRRLKE